MVFFAIMGKELIQKFSRETIFMPKQLHLLVSDQVQEKLALYAARTGKTMSESVNDALISLFDGLKKKPRKKGKFTFIDLFAGIGGMRLAFDSQGGDCVFSCEWDKYCQKSYFDNFGELPVGDIRAVAENSVPDHDVLVAGFPCQPFSIAGVSKKNSLGRATGFLDKTQGTLFFDVVRILNAKRPKAFLLENVKNLKSHDKGRTWQVIMDSLTELDYAVFPMVLDGQIFVPQHRERVFIVGFDMKRYGSDIQFSFDFDRPAHKMCLRDILEKDVDEKYTLSDKLWTYLQNYAAKHRAAGHGFGYGMPDLDGITRTLSARYYKDGSEILIRQDEKNPRRLTPRECARLQGFPESYKITVSNTRAYKQFGNSVVVPLVTAIAGCIVKKMKQLDKKATKDDESQTLEEARHIG